MRKFRNLIVSGLACALLVTSFSVSAKPILHDDDVVQQQHSFWTPRQSRFGSVLFSFINSDRFENLVSSVLNSGRIRDLIGTRFNYGGFTGVISIPGFGGSILPDRSASIPEPGSFILLASGGLLLLLRRGRQRRGKDSC